MEKEIEYINLKDIPEYVKIEDNDIYELSAGDLSDRKDILCNMLEKSLKNKNYILDYKYFYKSPKGNILFHKMDRLHRLNTFNYFSFDKKLIAKDYKELINNKINNKISNEINNKDIKCNLSIDLNPKSYDGFDVLCRVYKNQNPKYWLDEKNRNENKQICSEVLFRNGININHQRATSWLPRGAAAFIGEELNKIRNKNFKVGIFNQLDDDIGVLTSCRRNFEYAIEYELEKLRK